MKKTFIEHPHDIILFLMMNIPIMLREQYSKKILVMLIFAECFRNISLKLCEKVDHGASLLCYDEQSAYFDVTKEGSPSRSIDTSGVRSLFLVCCTSSSPSSSTRVTG